MAREYDSEYEQAHAIMAARVNDAPTKEAAQAYHHCCQILCQARINSCDMEGMVDSLPTRYRPE